MKHFYTQIQGWFSFSGVYVDAVKEAPKDRQSLFVEVGSWKGKSTSFMGVEVANSKKPIKFFAVDHFLGSDEPAHNEDQDIIDGTLFTTFKQNISPVKDYVNIMQMSSADASERFEDNTVDFLLLDGGHTYEDVKTDLDKWLPKMKSDGVVAGDDLNWPGVKQAIAEKFKSIEALGEGKGRHWRVRLNGRL